MVTPSRYPCHIHAYISAGNQLGYPRVAQTAQTVNNAPNVLDTVVNSVSNVLDTVISSKMSNRMCAVHNNNLQRTTGVRFVGGGGAVGRLCRFSPDRRRMP